MVEITFDTDIAARANFQAVNDEKKRERSAAEALLSAICDIRAGAVDLASLRSLAMSASSLAAAISTLKRASCAGKVGRSGKGILKRATQRTAGIFAMRAATTVAVTGALDGVLGADPGVVGSVCDKMRSIFSLHGAAQLHSPLLRPRLDPPLTAAVHGGPVEVINPRGCVLLLPEDLTGGFGM